jgi:hypothetical protein
MPNGGKFQSIYHQSFGGAHTVRVQMAEPIGALDD